MNRYTVNFINKDKSVAIKHGTTVLQAMIDAGLALDTPCGGKGTCGKCRVIIDNMEFLACRTIVDRDMSIAIPEGPAAKILALGKGKLTAPDGKDEFTLAIDIGTTTLVVYLLDGRTGEILSCDSAMNPQYRFGADVISRIQYALEQDGASLSKTVLEGLSALITQTAEKAGINPAQITATAIAGNTAMHHLMLDIDPRPLVTPPYMPTISEAVILDAAGLLPVSGKVRMLPNIAGFVGGDTAGCMLAAGFDELNETTLMIDIGTNGEMVLGDRSRRLACSTAAGPAFEGAKITCGMRGADGAIDHVWLEDGKIAWHVIGGTEPVGLCGSGLLDLIAVLLETGTIDETGYMDVEEFRLEGTPVYLTRKDVREVQLAKAAIYAGIFLMAEQLGISVKEISKVLLAGAFGNYMNPDSACRIGMIPACLREKIIPIGNAAGEGAKLCALSEKEFEKCKKLAGETEFLELASCPDFQDCYVDALELSEEIEIEL